MFIIHTQDDLRDDFRDRRTDRLWCAVTLQYILSVAGSAYILPLAFGQVRTGWAPDAAEAERSRLQQDGGDMHTREGLIVALAEAQRKREYSDCLNIYVTLQSYGRFPPTVWPQHIHRAEWSEALIPL